MEAKACALSSALIINNILAIPSGSALHGATEFRLVFNKIPQGVLHLIRRRKSSTRAATIHFHDMEDKEAYAAMIPCTTKGIAKEGSAYQTCIIVFYFSLFFLVIDITRFRKSQATDELSARCVGVRTFMQHRMSITSVRDRHHPAARRSRGEKALDPLPVSSSPKLLLIHTNRPDPNFSQGHISLQHYLLTHLMLSQETFGA